MTKKKNISVALFVALLIIAIVGILTLASESKHLISAPVDDGLSRPIILALDGSTIQFNCLDAPSCFPDINLGDPINTLNDSNTHPFSIKSAYYIQDSLVYLNLGGSVWDYLLKINPQTSQVQVLDLNVASLSSGADILPMFLPNGMKIIHGKIVVGTTDGKIGIVEDDFSLKTIDLKSPILDFIEATGSKIGAISAESSVLNGKQQAKVFLIDINSSEVEEKILSSPQDIWRTVAVDKDIHNLYWVSSDNKTLHLFDMQKQEDILSTPISNEDAFAYTTITSPRFQYQGIWYYGRKCPCEGPVPANLVNMSTLKPLINPEDLLRDEPASDRTFMIAPFGDNFLIGTHSRVLVISPDGTVIREYALSNEWSGQNYSLLEYQK